jgi:hypothetical protein
MRYNKNIVVNDKRYNDLINESNESSSSLSQIWSKTSSSSSSSSSSLASAFWPNKPVTFASSGPQSQPNLDVEWFKKNALDLDINHAFEEECIRAIDDWDKDAEISTKWEVAFESDDISAQCEGDKILKKIQYLLDHVMDGLGWKRTEEQIALHDAYLIASLPKIYGDEWESKSAEVMARFDVTKIKALVLSLMPRRYGKSVAVGCYVAVMMICKWGINIAAFSTGKRASGLLMEVLVKILHSNPGIQDRITKQNQEELHLSASKDKSNLSTTSIFHSYPSNPDGQYLALVFVYMYMYISM